MNELRWHPLLRQWVAVFTERPDRPPQPAGWCPFCPGSGRVPERYDVYLYPNDMPTLAADQQPFEPFDPDRGIYQQTAASGACDIVLYHPDHKLLPSQLPAEHWEKIIHLWSRRTRELAALEVVEYVSVFENRGAAIGVTITHPHGQIYAFPFVPPVVKTELDSAAEAFERDRECLYCRILGRELEDGTRLVAQNAGFLAFVPFFARFPSEVQIYPRRHFAALEDLSDAERRDLAALIRIVRQKYDNLYGLSMPLMMLVRQSPARGEHPYFHFHVEFLPVLRSSSKQKFLGSVELGDGMFLIGTLAEDRAEQLRAATPKGR